MGQGPSSAQCSGVFQGWGSTFFEKGSGLIQAWLRLFKKDLENWSFQKSLLSKNWICITARAWLFQIQDWAAWAQLLRSWPDPLLIMLQCLHTQIILVWCRHSYTISAIALKKWTIKPTRWWEIWTKLKQKVNAISWKKQTHMDDF